MEARKTMMVIPTMDIYDGKCVRLKQGKLDGLIVYDDSPLTYVKRFEDAGAERLHLVDINATLEGNRKNLSILQKIIQGTSMQVQVGGGIRNKETVNYYWKRLFVGRLMLGTGAVENRSFLSWASSNLREKMLVSVDAKDGMVVTNGWTTSSGLSVRDLMLILADCGVRRINYTDVACDGMLKGPNFPEVEKVLKYAQSLTNPIKVGVAGGISTMQHLKRLYDYGVDEAVVGRAIYEEDGLDLAEAIVEFV